MPPKKSSRKPPPSSSTHQDPPEGLPQKFSELTISDDNDALVSPTSSPAASTKPVMLLPQKKLNKKKEELVIVDNWEDEVSDVSDGSEGDVVVVGPRGGRRWDDDSVDEFDDEDGWKDTDTNSNTKATSKPFSSPPLPPAPPPNTKASSLGSSASSSRKASLVPGGSPPSWDSDLPLFMSPPSDMKSSYTAGEPEKRRQPTTDAVARRLIASALGIRAPKSTVEQKEYEASMKAQLKKKREKEKEEREARKREQEEVERRRREVWGD